MYTRDIKILARIRKGIGRRSHKNRATNILANASGVRFFIELSYCDEHHLYTLFVCGR